LLYNFVLIWETSFLAVIVNGVRYILYVGWFGVDFLLAFLSGAYDMRCANLPTGVLLL
jgi:hypothetical protein